MASNLGNLVATVALDVNPFQSSARTLNATIKATTQEMRAIDSSASRNGTSLTNLSGKYATVQKQLDNYQAKLRMQQEAYEKLSKKTADSADAEERLKIRQQNAAAQINRTKTAINQLSGQMDGLKSKIDTQSNAWLQVSESYKRYSDKLGGISTGFNKVADKTRGLSLGVVGAFTLATKSAMDFNSQIDEIGPLMTNGGKITAEVRQQLDQLGESSKKWASQYGVSTTAINQGMADLVRAGYDANQTLSLTPQILDASRASGEDFNTVLEVVTSTLTQFGIKAEDSAQVTDMMTYAANATKSGFADLGEALQYTGQSAHAAGVPLSLTVSALGALSNAGLQGSSAGTAFNAMLQALANNSNEAKGRLRELGVDIDAFQAGKIDITDVTDQLIKGTKDLTDVQRVAAINASFGERGGRAILALMNEGGQSLRNLTKETASASGATAEVAKQMGETASAKFDKFKQHVQSLGIELGQKLLPHAEKLLDNVEGLINWFDKLDDSTKDNILRFTALSAAVYPLSKVLGVATGAGSGLFNMMSLLTGGMGKTATASSTASGGFKGLASSVSSAVAEGGGFLPVLGRIAGGMNPVTLGITATTGALAVGYGAWKIWGENAQKAQDQTNRWGTIVGDEADSSLQKLKTFSDQGQAHLQQFQAGAKTSAEDLSKSINGMAQVVVDNTTENLTKFQDAIKASNNPEITKILEETQSKYKESQDKIVQSVKASAEIATGFVKKASQENRNLTDDETAYITLANQKSTKAVVDNLKVSQEEKNRIYAVMNRDYSNMSTENLRTTFQNFADIVNEENKAYKSNDDHFKQLLDSGAIQEDQYNKLADMNLRNRDQRTDTLYKSMLDMARKDEHFTDNVRKYMKDMAGANTALKDSIDSMSNDDLMNAYFTKFGLNVNDAIAASNRLGDSVKTVQSVISTGTKQADSDWNSLVLDEKTGTVKTNAQDTLNELAKTKQGWDKLEFLRKNANLSTNAKNMILEAELASGKWDDLSFNERIARIEFQGAKDLYSALSLSGDWNKMSLGEKTAVVTCSDVNTLVDLVRNYNIFNELPDNSKRLIVDNEDAMKKLGDARMSAEIWKGQHLNPISLQVDDSDFTKKIKDNAKKIDDWNNGFVPITKMFTGDSQALFNSYNEAKNFIDQYDALDPQKKQFLGDNTNVVEQVNAAKATLELYNGLPPDLKRLTGDNGNVMQAVNQASGNLNGYNSLLPGLKTLKAIDNTQTATDNAMYNLNRFGRGNESFSKTFTFSAQFNKGFTDILGSITGRAKGVTDLPHNELAMVNDENVADYHEAIRYPNGRTVIPKGRNVTTFLPKGTSVIPARITKQMFKIPRFAGGTPKYSKAVDEINRLQPNYSNTSVTNVTNQTDLSGLKEVLASKSEPNVNLNLTVYGDLDSRTAKKWAQVMANELENLNRRRSLGGA